MTSDWADFLDRSSRRAQPAWWSSSSSDGMVATAHYRATAAAADVLRRGGNAVDAAVTAAFALGVCEPGESGLGGMVIATVFDAATGKTSVVEGQCRAPAAADPEIVRHLDRYRGYGVVAVPTAVPTLEHLLHAFGTWSDAAVLEPAIELAEDGFGMTPHLFRLATRYREQLLAGNAAAPFFAGSEPRATGVILRQSRLAATLRRLARHGLRDFSAGETAAQIDADMRASGGFVRATDLERCQPRIRSPLEIQWSSPAFGPCTIHVPGPPAGGIALAQMLQLDDALPELLSAARTPTEDCPVRVASIIHQARTDRRRTAKDVGATNLGEAGFLLTAEHAATAAGHLRDRFAAGIEPETFGDDTGGDTTHLAVMDRAGNAVSLTASINRCFGAAVATPELGFLYNGYLRGFKVEDAHHPHFLREGATARSNSVPVLGLRDGRPCLAVGASGSERIPSVVFQILTALGRGFTPFAALHAPRLHATPEGVVRLERERFEPAVPEALCRAGFKPDDVGDYAFFLGGAQLVVRDAAGVFTGAADPRRDGTALGPDQVS